MTRIYLAGAQLDERSALRLLLLDLKMVIVGEAASAICVPLGTIKSRLARARLRLRQGLHEYRELLPASFFLDGASEVVKLKLKI